MVKTSDELSTTNGLADNPNAILNYEGGLAFTRDPRRALVKMAACCLVKERSFYEDTTGKVFALIKKVGETDPQWLVKLAVFLREELRLRSVVHYIAAYCLTLPAARASIARAYDRVAPRIDDSLEIAALLKDDPFGFGSSLPHVARRLLARRLNRLSEFEVIKYRRRSRFGLRHLLNMVHPRPVSRSQEHLYRYVLSGKTESGLRDGDGSGFLPQVSAYEDFKRIPRGHIQRICELIEEGRLPWEVALPAAGSKRDIWAACAKTMPVMALIRNLRNLNRSRALGDPEIRKIILEKLRDRATVLNSKQLPFRWLSAYRAISDEDPEIGEALLGALEISLSNLPRFSGTTFVSCDNSGSMSWSPLSGRSTLVPADIANLLGAMIFHLSDRGFVSVFAEDFAWVPLSKGDRAMANWEKISKTDVGHATYAFKTIQHLLKEELFVDRIIIPTDMIIYSPKDETDEASTFISLLRHYRRRVNPRVKTYIINLQPYEYFLSPEDGEGVTTISGWSESILNYIDSDSATDGSNMVDIVGRVRL